MSTAPAHIREATHADAAALAALAARTFPLACPPGTDPDDIAGFIATVLSPEAFTSYLDDDQRIVTVAVHHGSLLGYTMLVIGKPADPDVARAITAGPSLGVDKFYVDPSAHGTGVASALMDRAVRDARDRARRTLWLGVNYRNDRALAFYRRCGFERVGTRRFRLGSVNHHDYVMQREVGGVR